MGILIIQKEIFVIKQIHINEEQQLLVKFSLHECEHLTDQYQYVSWANMKSFTRLSVKHVFALIFTRDSSVCIWVDSAYFR